MKNSIFTILILSGLFFNSCQEQVNNEPENNITEKVETKKVINESAEKEAILTVIESETKCFFQRDYECWKNYWVQKPYTFQAWNNADGTYDSKVGWKTVSEGVKKYLAENPIKEGEAENRSVKRNNIQANFYNPNLAYLIWEQINQTRDGKSCRKSQETRIMEKIDGDWRIAHISSFWDYNTEIPLEELKK